MQPLIVVDAANVVGSRPDGWWRDRAGATRRLLAELDGYRGDDALVLVTEGRARVDRAGPDRPADPHAAVPGTPAAPGPSAGGRVTVVHAPGSGDDRIVALVAEALAADPGRMVTVVTADRGLRDRVRALGATTAGPRWLFDRL
ncbi:hypothetical protein Lfu02_12840 [Longispora fulva]|uniref:NTP pyrophosphohydrolase n=1 Tax=Longispora fulva TaxID=619741 RepID=A0A8J7KIW7_9ACTN|nr:hypothetical protein [Longispora fulva]MBG6134856.1 hypothetical protein [Longispora fulva]GIG56912.1 hypothetical protein Lfu02_12840 [Longispora fulva]